MLTTNTKALNKIVLKYLFPSAITLVLLSCANTKGNYSDKSEPEMTDEQFSAEIAQYKKQTLTAGEFVRWCADEQFHLKKTKNISEFAYKLQYMPKEAMAMLELRNEDFDSTRFRTTCTYYSDMTYFNLRIEATGHTGEVLKYKLQSPQQYESRIKYISFAMQNDICLVQGNDTIPAGMYQFERAFEAAPYASVMLAFDPKKFDVNKEFTLVFNDKLFDKGYIKFNYKNGQLINLPNISGL